MKVKGLKGLEEKRSRGRATENARHEIASKNLLSLRKKMY